jgi:hypothetical protein
MFGANMEAKVLVAQRINNYVTKTRPLTLCDKCIAAGMGLKNESAHPAQITAALGTTSDFTREHGQCSVCKRQKTVIYANPT